MTTNLTLDFIGAAKSGDWLETAIEFHKLGRRVGFANCYVLVTGRLGEG